MTIRNMIKPTADNLRSKVATEPLTRWLISAAKQRTTLTYGEGKHRLEVECGFRTIFSMKMGIVAGAVMDKILEREPSARSCQVNWLPRDQATISSIQVWFYYRYLGAVSACDALT